MNPLKDKCVSIIGIGQIGGSIGLSLMGKARMVAGVDTNHDNLKYAMLNGMIDQALMLERAIQESDMIVVATPVDVALELIPAILNSIRENTVVIDMGSTKEPICRVTRNHPRRRNFVAAHPMAGSSVKGPQGADAALFCDRKVLVCQPELSSVNALNSAIELFHLLGASVEFIDERDHDRLVGLISHLPQVLSYVLANVVGVSEGESTNWLRFASTGFNSSTRLAKSPASMWSPIIMQNSENILRNIQMAVSELELLSDLIRSGNTHALEVFINRAVEVRNKFETSNKTENNLNHGNKCTTRVTAA